MPAPIHFTKAAVEALLPGPRRVRYRDAKQPGLVLVVEPGGARTWFLYARRGGRLHETRIGAFPQFAVDQARAKVAEGLAAIEHGHDPREAVGRPRGRDRTVAELWAWYREAHAHRVRHWAADQALVDLHLLPAIGSRQLRLVTKSDLRELHAAILRGVAERKSGTGHRTANHAIILLRAAWNKALAHDWTTVPNPAVAVDLLPLPERDRRLTKAEAQALLAALEESDAHLRDLVLLLLYTGARKGNLLAMRWDELDLDDADGAWWRIPRTKAGKAQVIPLEAVEVAILRRRRAEVESAWVFPARTGGAAGHLTEPKKGWDAARKRAGIPDVRLHDLRRSLGSFMFNSGTAMGVISKALGHSSIAVTEKVYAHLDMDPIRAAKRRAIAAIQGEG